MSIQRLVCMVGLGLAVSLVFSSPALAKKKKRASFSSYAIPFTCGTTDGTMGAVAGDYATAVTVTNVSLSDTMARARVQLTHPTTMLSDAIRRTLPARRSFQVDCDTLENAFIQPVPEEAGAFAQGVLTIDSRQPLSVVVQTSATGSEGGISVENRQVPGTVVHLRRARDEDDEKVCHIPPGNPRNLHTIRVDRSAVGAHLGHGDYRGECDDDDDDDDDHDDD